MFVAGDFIQNGDVVSTFKNMELNIDASLIQSLIDSQDGKTFDISIPIDSYQFIDCASLELLNDYIQYGYDVSIDMFNHTIDIKYNA